jgi:hypothetical protein
MRIYWWGLLSHYDVDQNDNIPQLKAVEGLKKYKEVLTLNKSEFLF